MNTRTTIILLLLSVVVTVFAFRDARYRSLPFQRDLDQPFAFTAEGVIAIEVQAATTGSLVLVRNPGGWRIMEPLEDRANQPLLEDLIDTVLGLRVRGEGSEGAFLAANPPLALRLKLVGGRRVALVFGNDHGDLPFVYARLTDSDGGEDGGRVVLLDTLLRDSFREISLRELRDPTVCEIPLSRISRLQIDGGDESLVVEQGKGGWTVTGEVQSDASPEAVRRFLETIVSWRSIDFPDLEPVQVGLAEGMEPRAIVTIVERGSGRTQILLVGEPMESSGEETIAVITGNRPGILAVPRSRVIDIIETPSARMRSPFLLRLPDPDIGAVTIRKGDYGEVLLTRSGAGGWQIGWAGAEEMLLAEPGTVDEMIRRLRETRVLQHLPLDDQNLHLYGFDQPSLELSIRSDGGNEEKLIVGARCTDDGSHRFLWNRDQAGFARAIVPDLAAWRSAPFSLRRRRVVEIDEVALVSFRLTADGRSATFDRPGSEWRLRGDQERLLPRADLKRLVKDIARMRALNWLASPESPPGSNRNQLRVDILPVDGGEAIITFWFGPVDGTGLRVVRIEGGWSFILPPGDGPDLVFLARALIDEIQDEEGSQ
ncbi:MAG TPA: DUF4340 domain-containing protein [Planctomycetes bacterium]|nr:DUF4340 domain-containing protein [Planctomycetota bacterium]